MPDAAMPPVKVGDKVKYSPDRSFALDHDREGNVGRLFHWHHTKAGIVGHPSDQHVYQKGHKVRHLGELGQLTGKNEHGHLETAGGHVIEQGAAAFFWDAEVLAVHSNGCDLLVQ